MKKTLNLITLLLTILMLNCGGEEPKKKDVPAIKLKTQKTEKEVISKSNKASEIIDLSNKGVGPIKSLTLNDEIDQKMATHGAEVFKKMCTACHKVGKKFIGPPPNGILKKRTPEWIMNMILDPEGMVKNDSLAKALLEEYNFSPMANQNLKKEEARAILEYFRTLN